MGRGSKTPLLGQKLGESPAVQREQERGATLGGAAATTTAALFWAPCLAANVPNHQGPLFHRGHPSPRLSPRRLREDPLLTPLHLCARWMGGLPRSRRCMRSTVTRAPCSLHHRITITIASTSSLSSPPCKASPLILYREARYPVGRCLAPHTPNTCSWPISPSSPSLAFRVVTAASWWGVRPLFRLSPNTPRPPSAPSITFSPHTLSEGGAAALVPNCH